MRLRSTLVHPNGTRATHTLPAPPGAVGVVVVLDGRGAATAAWTSRGRLYAAGAWSAGRWSKPQLIARRHAAVPALAVAQDRRVLLVWTVNTPTGARPYGSRLARSRTPLLAHAAAEPSGAGPDAG